MAVVQLPANLILLRPRTGFRGTARAPETQVAPILSRRGLLERLDTIGELAPNSPLSFLLVRIDGIDAGAAEGLTERQVMGMMGMRILGLTRPTDSMGEYSASSFGIVLQGTGATAASAVAARLTFHLNNLGEALAPGTNARVYVATGLGMNAETLPIAAIDSLDECS
jgi:GGDEF domain-containing protein